MKEIVIIDYGMGNLRSVYNKLRRIGCKAEISSDSQVIANADKLIIPGVGHFANGMNKLSEYGLLEILNKKVLDNSCPILGICLGMQLLGKFSEEGNVEGLDWVTAQTVHFRIKDEEKYIYKIPHMGWNNVNVNGSSILFNGLDKDSLFYFVHSYHFETDSAELLKGVTHYGYEFVSYVETKNIFGAQFHPEKSQDAGEQFLRNFVNI